MNMFCNAQSRSRLIKAHSLLACSALALAGALVAVPAQAQQASESESRTDGSASSSDDILVTARKRSERLQDVPATITAFSGDQLASRGTGTILQVAEQTPQLVIATTSTPSGGVINLRGIGAPDAAPSVDQTVSINIDGVQVSQADAVRLGFVDLERIEVLKGPQALFFGKSSPAGVISLVSASPGNTFEWRVRTGYEFKAETRFVDGMMSVPLSDTLGVRVAGAYSGSEGWFRNRARVVAGGPGVAQPNVLDKEEYFVRGTLAYAAPGGGFDATLKVSYGNLTADNSANASSQTFACALGVPQGSFGVVGANTDCTADRYTDEADISPAAAALAPGFFRNGRGYYTSQQTLTSLTLNVPLTDTLKLTSVTGYFSSRVRWSATFNAGDVERLVTASDTKNEQATQEVRLASSLDSPVNFVVGGFYQHATLDFGVPAVFSGPLALPSPNPLLLSNDLFHQRTTAYSGFGQVIWAVSPEIEVTAGGRYSHEDKEANGVRLPSVRSGFQTAALPMLQPQVSFNNFSPEITARYKPAANVTLFAAYRTGFTSGGYNFAPISFSTTVPNDNVFEQAKAEGGEGGIRARIADRQISFDLTGYYYKFTDLQLSAIEPGTASLTVNNAGSASIRGVEFSGSVSPRAIPGLRLHSSIAYNDAKYDQFNNSGCYAGQTRVLGCTGNIVAGVATTQDLTGTQLERAPRWTMSYGGQFEGQLAGGVSGFVSGDANYTSSFLSDRAHDPRSLQKSVWRLNASIGVRGSNDGWELSLVGRNLTNELRVNRSSGTPLTGFGTGTNGPSRLSDLSGDVSEPRTILLQFTIRSSAFQ